MTLERLRMASAKVTGVVDRYGSALALPFMDGCATEVLARQVFEHLSLTEAKAALQEFRRVLLPRGLLRLDVPDTEETAKLLSETKDPFYIRHLFGSRKDDYGYHLMGYDRAGLTQLGGSTGSSSCTKSPTSTTTQRFASTSSGCNGYSSYPSPRCEDRAVPE
jgi:hypothetical protein